MRLQTTLGAAIAAVLLAGSAHAASYRGAQDEVKALAPSLAKPASSQRFIVKTSASATAGRAMLTSALRSSTLRAGLGVAVKATATSPARPVANARVLRSMGLAGWHVVRTSRPLSASEQQSFIRELSAERGVLSVEVDHLYQRGDVARATRAVPALVPNDPNYARLQWNFFDPTGGVRAPEAWNRTTGQGTVVAVIDTGIVQNHQDLAGNVLPGYDMISDQRISRRDADGRVPGGWDVGDWMEENYCETLGAGPNEARPSSWHGSHVAGTIAQETNNGVGLAGLAHGAKVVPVRVLGSCGGYGSDISDGMLWAAGISVDGIPDNANPAEVINMSLGSGGPSSCPSVYQDAINQINARGSIIVVAAGNDNGDAGRYTMSSCNGVISVGATSVAGEKAYYSNWGRKVDLSAPGGGGQLDPEPNGYIWQVLNGGTTRPTTQWINGGYIGTSMASPHVAAAVALAQSVAPTPLSWTQMRDALRRTARPFPADIPNTTPIGSGILDVPALLTRVSCTQDCGPPLVVLANRVELRGQSSVDGEAIYSFVAQAGKTLSFTTAGGSGVVGMHAAHGRLPTATDRDAFSVRAGTTSQTVRFTAPRAGTYYVRLTGEYNGASIVARQ